MKPRDILRFPRRRPARKGGAAGSPDGPAVLAFPTEPPEWVGGVETWYDPEDLLHLVWRGLGIRVKFRVYEPADRHRLDGLPGSVIDLDDGTPVLVIREEFEPEVKPAWMGPGANGGLRIGAQ